MLVYIIWVFILLLFPEGSVITVYKYILALRSICSQARSNSGQLVKSIRLMSKRGLCIRKLMQLKPIAPEKQKGSPIPSNQLKSVVSISILSMGLCSLLQSHFKDNTLQSRKYPSDPSIDTLGNHFPMKRYEWEELKISGKGRNYNLDL